MAQLRQDYPQFVARDIEVVVVGPEDARAFADYWQPAQGLVQHGPLESSS
jgi:hypothetical protein